MEKREIVEKLIAKLKISLETLDRAIKKARAQAINAPASIQSWSDTTKFQSSKLAANLESRYKQLIKCINDIKKLDISKISSKVGVGALIKVKKDGDVLYYFISPQGVGGEIININEHEVITLSTESPLAQIILGKKAGDKISFKIEAETKNITIQKIT